MVGGEVTLVTVLASVRLWWLQPRVATPSRIQMRLINSLEFHNFSRWCRLESRQQEEPLHGMKVTAVRHPDMEAVDYFEHS